MYGRKGYLENVLTRSFRDSQFWTVTRSLNPIKSVSLKTSELRPSFSNPNVRSKSATNGTEVQSSAARAEINSMSATIILDAAL